LSLFVSLLFVPVVILSLEILVCREGEIFGLLGINGAQKTTALGILTGEINYSTGGDVYIGGNAIAGIIPINMKK